MQVIDNDDQDFFELISECVVFDICDRIFGLEDGKLYEKAIAEYLRSAYTECIGANVNTKHFARAIYHLNKLRQIIGRLSRTTIRLQDGYKQLSMDVYDMSKILNGSDVEIILSADSQLTYRKLMTNLGQVIDKNDDSEDGIQKQLICLHQCLVELQRINNDINPNAEIVYLLSIIKKFELKFQGDFRKFVMGTRGRVGSRLIARSFNLGTYANLNGNEQNFAHYVERFISFYIMLRENR
ncbi:MAG: hypothetical protein K5837_00455 [Candidatus Saccharibacteria bacterium]|nr:hypothetical protein [Candidatus Saccharibacteria bacterium]